MEKMREKELALDLLADVAGGFVQAVALHCFINNIDIAPPYEKHPLESFLSNLLYH